MLAVEEINAAGGINGRPLELLAEDDLDTPEGAVQADVTLLQKGVVAIIGHMTTRQTLAAYPHVEDKGGVMISPTTAAPALDGRKDCFFRVIPSNTKWAKVLAAYAASRQLDSACFVGDSDNTGYTDTFLDSFQTEYARLGGRLLDTCLYSSRAGTDWTKLAARVRAAKPRLLVACMAARDLVSLSQELAPRDSRLAVMGPPWPATSALPIAGGSLVEGFRFVSNYVEENPYPGFAPFQESYMRRFGWRPGFPAAFAYETVVLLADALKHTQGDRKGLREALANGQAHKGVIDDFAMTESGDVDRPTFITRISGGHYVVADTIRGSH